MLSVPSLEFCPLIDTLDHIFPHLSGDEVVAAMQVCKLWHGKIIFQKKSIASSLNKLILFISAIFERNKLDSVKKVMESLSTTKFTAQTSLLGMEDELDIIIQIIAAHIIHLNEEEKLSILSNDQFPMELTACLQFFMAIEKIKCEGYLEHHLLCSTVSEYPGQLRWKCKLEKEIHSSTSKYKPYAIYFHLILELAKKRYFDLAIHLSEKSMYTRVFIAKHLVKQTQISRACELLKGLTDSQQQVKGLLKIIPHAPLDKIIPFWSIDNIFTCFMNFDKTDYDTYKKHIVLLVYELFKNKYDKKAMEIVLKVGPQFYKDILSPLVKLLLKGDLIEQALGVIEKFMNGVTENHQKRNIEDEQSKLLFSVVAYLFRTGNKPKSLEVASMIPNATTRDFAKSQFKQNI